MSNRTPVVILQHARERFHPFGTARLTQLSLRKVTVALARRDWQGKVHHPIELPPGTALLYPRPGAPDLANMPAEDHPKALLVLDGTWSGAHCLYRDNPWMQDLPHVQLSPSEPSRYQIRKEPAPHCLSTIESIHLALKQLEPDNVEVDKLLHGFDAMIGAQLEARGGTARVRRRIRSHARPKRAIPEALLQRWPDLVIAYAEKARQVPEQAGRCPVLQWAAIRPATGEVFEYFIQPPNGVLSDAHLAQMQLDPTHFHHPGDTHGLAEEWRRFLGPDAIVACWNRKNGALIAEQTDIAAPTQHLKAIYGNLLGAKSASLEKLSDADGGAPIPVSGRAAVQLARALQIAHFLRDHGYNDDDTPEPS